jgi:hypothetical protein
VGLLLGLPAVAISIAAVTVLPASAATGPGGKPALPASAFSAVPRHAAPAHQPAPRKPARHASANDLCLLELGSFTASAYTVPVGNVVTLTPATTCDIGPTPYYLQIFNVTTGALIQTLGSGTGFPVGVGQLAAGTDEYIAYLDSYSTSFPPSGVYQQSAPVYITWEAPPNNFQVSLSGPSQVPFGGGPATYTATVNQNVGPTPYWIEIFDETTGTRLAVCGSGTTCSVSFTPSTSGDNLVAFVSANSTALPPSATQANSAVLNTYQEPFIQ